MIISQNGSAGGSGNSCKAIVSFNCTPPWPVSPSFPAGSAPPLLPVLPRCPSYWRRPAPSAQCHMHMHAPSYASDPSRAPPWPPSPRLLRPFLSFFLRPGLPPLPSSPGSQAKWRFDSQGCPDIAAFKLNLCPPINLLLEKKKKVRGHGADTSPRRQPAALAQFPRKSERTETSLTVTQTCALRLSRLRTQVNSDSRL